MNQKRLKLNGTHQHVVQANDVGVLDGSIIQRDSKRWTQLRKSIFCLYTDSLFAQIGDSNDECSSSLEIER